MFSPETIQQLKKTVFDLVGFTYEGEVTVKEGVGLTVKGDAKSVAIEAESRPALARAFFRLAQELSAGAQNVDIHEEKQFDSCGCYIDFSRNGVMTVEGCKRYMDYSAALGLNLIVLYTEDTFEVPEYPYMGYLRGRYSQAELKELDAYAVSLGIELVPNIQTLGHLEQFLQWSAYEHLQDQTGVIMVDEPETYEFIEAQVRSCRECVSSKRIHIGMDEAHGVGLGQFLRKYGMQDRFEILSRHLKRVVEICEKYDFYPMMWSDMFFRLGSKTNNYYDMESDIPQSVIDALPNVGLVYWDYYHTDETWYEHMLTQHEKMSPDTIFAGGIWTWSGFLPQVDYTWATMTPGLKVCARHKVKTVLATMWGDNGQECSHFLALNQVPMFSEFCWRGEDCPREVVEETGAFLTGIPAKAYNAFAAFHPGPVDNRTSKAMLYCDPLYPIGPWGDDEPPIAERSKKAIETLAPYQDNLLCRYASTLFEAVRLKALLVPEIREHYQAGDRAWFAQAAEETIPAVIAAYEALRDVHREVWERDYKRNGWEVLAIRYGGLIGRLQDVAYAMSRYANGTLDTLCELDEEPRDPARKSGKQYFATYVTPSFIS